MFGVNFIKLNGVFSNWQSYQLANIMAAKGITLAPVRMGSLVSNSVAKPASKYTPPSKRTGSNGKAVAVLEKIDMSDKNFPSLGAVPVKVNTWGKHVVTSVINLEPNEKKDTLSDKIKEKIRLDAIAEELGASKEELDPWKMSHTELNNSGWVRLDVNSARDISTNGFTSKVNPHLSGFIAEADAGMSFEEYVHYKGAYKQKNGVVTSSPTKAITAEVEYDEYSEEEDDE
jgi:hypothetical protein